MSTFLGARLAASASVLSPYLSATSAKFAKSRRRCAATVDSVRNFSRRNRENKYPVCGPIRARLGSDEPHPSEAKNLAQRLEEMKLAQGPLTKIDIGLPEDASLTVSRKERLSLEADRRTHAPVNADEFDALAPETKAKLSREWMRSVGPLHLTAIGEHAGIFRDLFGPEYFFHPRIPLNVEYVSASAGDVDIVSPVYFGNYIRPCEAASVPSVTIGTEDPSSLWCLLMTSPDGHFTEENSEYIHYLVGNIRGSDLSSGEVLAKYMQPFPPKGTGYHRYVFLLFKQNKTVDFGDWKVDENGYDLKARTFSTYDFYAALQEDMTPAGFSFFQATYDRSLRSFFQEKLDMREPVYEYDFPEPNYRPQVRYPIPKPFNYYLDRYKHPQQINKEVLLLRLKSLHPFEGEAKRLKYPMAHKTPWGMASWVKQDLYDRALKEGKYKDI